MAGNFRGVLFFHYFRGSFTSHKNFHPQKLIPVQLYYVWKADQQGAWPKHRGMPQSFQWYAMKVHINAVVDTSHNIIYNSCKISLIELTESF